MVTLFGDCSIEYIKNMGKTYDEIDEKLADWIQQQKVFFVATAPLSGDGLVNCSPKGLDTFRVLSPNEVAYLDYAGSGVETIAHIRENSRVTIMMCSFVGPPIIYRFQGKGTVYEKGTPEFAEAMQHFEDHPGARSIIHVKLLRISDSCGWGVPFYDYVGDRDSLTKWGEKKGEDGVREYCQKNNKTSLDGLPGVSD